MPNFMALGYIFVEKIALEVSRVSGSENRLKKEAISGVRRAWITLHILWFGGHGTPHRSEFD